MTELSDRVRWDAVAEVEAKYAHVYDERAGEVVAIYVLASGLRAWGHMFKAGDVVAVAIGSPQFWLTVDIDTGRSWLDMTSTEQVQAWSRVAFTTAVPPEALESTSAQHEIWAAVQRAEQWAQARAIAARLEAG